MEYTQGQQVIVSQPGRQPFSGIVAHVHTALGYVAVSDDKHGIVQNYPESFVTTEISEPVAAKKVYKRTENGTVTYTSIQEALAEVNHAMMDGRRNVRSMSSACNHHAIQYKDGRKVTMVLVDAPEKTEPVPVEGVQEWGTASASMLLHKINSEGRAKCNQRIRWYARPLSQTEGARLQTRAEILAKEHAHLYTFCPRCEEK